MSFTRQVSPNRVLVHVHVQPGCSNIAATATANSTVLKLRVQAPARDGQANAQVISTIRKLLGRGTGIQVTIARGEQSKDKMLMIHATEQIDADAVGNTLMKGTSSSS